MQLTASSSIFKMLMQAIDIQLKNKSIPTVIALSIAVNFVISLLLSIILTSITGIKVHDNFLVFDSPLEEILVTIIGAPLLETLLYQYFPFKILKKFINPYLIIILCGVLFALVHQYNIIYIINGFFAGCIFAYTYYITSLRKLGFLSTVLSHMIYNTIAYFFNHLFA
jgi:uncharacterized protein